MSCPRSWPECPCQGAGMSVHFKFADVLVNEVDGPTSRWISQQLEMNGRVNGLLPVIFNSVPRLWKPKENT